MPDTPPPSITDLAAERVEQLVRPELWPRPHWLTADDTRTARRFEEHWAGHLRDRYIELEARFLGLLAANGAHPDFDRMTAGRAEEVLRLTRTELEDSDPELPVIHNRLDMVQRKLIKLLPHHELYANTMSTAARLAAEDVNDALVLRLDSLLREERSPATEASMRAMLDEAERQLTDHQREEWLGGKLQIARLLAWRWGALFLVFALVVFSPVLIQKASLNTYTLQLPAETLAQLPPFIPTDVTPWVYAVTVGVFGAVGAGLSALLSLRRTRVSLREYEVNRVSMQLKIFIGSLVALISLVLLSWGMVPGIEVTSPGTYLLVAFLSGFSERYFLNMLKVEDSEEEKQDG